MKGVIAMNKRYIHKAKNEIKRKKTDYFSTIIMEREENMKKHIGLKGILFIVFMCTAVVNVICQTNNPKEKKQILSPALMIQNESGEQKPLRLKKLSINAEVVGNFAVTTIDMTFYNDLDRVLEGELVFPLGEGQTVSRFAMELNGILREGVVVGKAQGRKVFEEIVRRRIDPALLEMTVGNTFRSRVYPIPAKGTKRIVMAYEQELRRSDEGQVFTLPMDYTDPVDSFFLHAELKHLPLAPDLRNNVFENIRFERLNKNFVADFAAANFTANKPLTILMPSGIEQKMRVFMGKRPNDVNMYFYITGQPKVKEQQKKLPRSITLLWDNSGSSLQNDKEKILDALEQYLRLCGNCTVQLVEFALKPTELGTFSILCGNSSALRTRIEQLIPDGATRLNTLNMKEYNTNEIILITDGVQTFGKGDMITGKTPITILNATQTAEHGYLRKTALQTGGQYINCAGLNADEILKKMTILPLQFIGAKTSVQAEIYPSFAQPINGDFTLAGRTKNNTLSITLQFGFGTEIFSEETITVIADSAAQSPVTPRLWGQKKLSELDMEFEKNKKLITDLGKEFSIVTKTTSLIVLELISDYVKYRIVPPTEELRTEYNRLVQLDEVNKKVQNDNRLDAVVTMTKRKNEWYEDFNKQYENDRTARHIIEAQARRADSLNRRRVDSLQKIQKRKIGTIEGKVVDSRGKSLVGATVKLLGTKRGANTKPDGSFRIMKVDRGTYTLEASFVGYSTERTQVVVDSGVTINADIVMKLRPTTNEAIVSAERYKEMVKNDVIGTVRERKGEPETKIAVESVQQAVALSAGVQQDGGGFIVRGSRSEATQIRVDGLDIGDQFTGGLSGGGNRFSPSVSNLCVEEVPILSGRFDAEIRDNNWDYGFNPPPNIEYCPIVSGGGGGYSSSSSKKRPEVVYPDYRKMCEDSLKNIDEKEYYTTYLRLRRHNSMNAAFYAEAADIFMEKGQKENGLRILSNLAELKMENQRLLRILGRRLLRYGWNDEAVYIFREVLAIREEEPQSMRDLGLALAEAGKYQEAVDTLYAMTLRKWDSRFPEIENIALNEMNNVIAKAGNKVQTDAIDKRLLYKQPLDLRIVLDWDADNCDIDLWVIDPKGEKCFYSNPNTKIGGKLSRDLTGGYGPEEFTLKNAIPGTYSIQVNYYGDRQQSIAGPTTINVQICTDYGKPTEKKKDISMRMKSTQEVVDVGEIKIAKK